MNMMKKIHFEIGELLLDGFNYHDHLRIKKAIENELIQLVSDKGLAHNIDGNSSNVVIDGGEFQLANTSNPNYIGREIARSIHNTLIRN
jgi:hypothetical protein